MCGCIGQSPTGLEINLGGFEYVNGDKHVVNLAVLILIASFVLSDALL